MDSLATCSCSGQNTHSRSLPVLPESFYERRIGHVDAGTGWARLIASLSIKSTFWSKNLTRGEKTPSHEELIGSTTEGARKGEERAIGTR